ncbi:response regulator transcription factor [Pectinatus haikarae]|uniref:DNA-binding response OmpR family regulator n=1 Tax=Pectinatus haikarae TaxID=349096 RepID=A0ABT9Y6Y2_9FIRM|nr:response regulator transcription factor [Pectinatus haikarae]MDQ0203572.1 DNA-binding response OmpR family regulator [Pectinatus haikarae]
MSIFSVLIVDDDEKLVKLLKAYFDREDFITYTAEDGLSALQAVKDKSPSVIILDLMLPGMSGWDVCKQVRRDNDTPILMLTARDEESDRLIGLEIGADDYVTKPFSPREVVARVKAILRRVGNSVVNRRILKMDNITIDPERHQVFNGGLPVELTPTEFKLLELLAGNPGKVFTRLQIVEQTQGYMFDGYERTIDTHIKNLRRKLEADPKNPRYLQTVYGIGYKFNGGSNE